MPKNGREDLDFNYLKNTIEPVFRELAKGRKGDNGEDEFTKLYPSMIADIMIPLPIGENGEISYSAQCDISQKYTSVNECKKEVLEKLDKLILQKIEL